MYYNQAICRKKESQPWTAKAESKYGKIFYVPQPPMTTCKVTLGVSMCCNQAVCRRKESQPWTANKRSPSP
jgi:hypothetical protein